MPRGCGIISDYLILSPDLLFLVFFFSAKRQGRPTNKARIFILAFSGKEGKDAQKVEEFLEKQLTKVEKEQSVLLTVFCRCVDKGRRHIDAVFPTRAYQDVLLGRPHGAERKVTFGTPVFCFHVFINRVHQTVSGNKPSQYPLDTIRWTLFRCSLRGKKPCPAELSEGISRVFGWTPVWRYSPANSPDIICWTLFRTWYSFTR